MCLSEPCSRWTKPKLITTQGTCQGEPTPAGQGRAPVHTAQIKGISNLANFPKFPACSIISNAEYLMVPVGDGRGLIR